MMILHWRLLLLLLLPIKRLSIINDKKTKGDKNNKTQSNDLQYRSTTFVLHLYYICAGVVIHTGSAFHEEESEKKSGEYEDDHAVSEESCEMMTSAVAAAAAAAAAALVAQ